MKLVKMSLVAAMVMGASAFAIDNVKVSGDAKVYYSTSDEGTLDLFDQGNSAADTALRLGVTGDLTKGVSFGMTGYAVSALGLENNLVGDTWSGAHKLGNGAEDAAWMSELWLAATVGKTTAKVGRMELDTPFAFSEKWSIATNTFDAAVLINQDIADTTLIGAWIGRGNGVNAASPVPATLGIDTIMSNGAQFGTFADKGAYAAAVINNSFKPLVAQAWYYNVVNVADAYWLQADWDCQLVKDVKVGAQYANLSPKGMLDGNDNSSAYAFKLGYEGIENLKVSAAYSKVDDKGLLDITNVATNNMATAESKLYTEAFWNRGYVGEQDARTWNAKASYDVKDVAKFSVSYTDVNNGNTSQQSNTSDMTEVSLVASKSFGPLDAKLAYISTDADDQNNGSQYNMLQAYLTLNF